MKTTEITVILCLLTLSPRAAYGLSPGYYDHSKMGPILEAQRAADRHLLVAALDKISIPPLFMGKSFYFKRTEIKDFLSEEKHKALLWVDVYRKSLSKQQLAQLRTFCKEAGYARVLILEPGGDGSTVLVDDEYRKAQ